MDLRRLYRELQRRHVIRVTSVYLVGAWVMVEVASTVFPLLGWSDEAAKLVLVTAIVGLPITILLSWLFDLTPAGLQRTASADAAADVEPGSVPGGGARRSLGARAAGLVGLGVIVALIGFAAISRHPKPSSPHIESIAVLPFADLSPGQDQEYFTDGVTEEIMNRLAEAGLRVAARTSSFAFKGQNVEVTEIARRLNVDAVLEGSIRRDGDSLRATVKLIDATTQSVIWGEQFHRGAANIFALQDEISAAIVNALKLKLDRTRALAAGTRNVAAQELYFKGLQAWHDGTDPQLRAALAFFEQAIDADSGFALAYAGLAKTYAVLPSFGDYPLFDALSLGKAAAARATALAPSLGDAYAALGQIAQNLEWDLATALQNYRSALSANSNDAATHQWYAEALIMTGDLDAAAAEITRALELDPLSAPAKNLRAYQMLLRGEQAAAARMYQILLREHPSFDFGQLNFALAALAMRDYGDAAKALVAALPQFGPDIGVFIAAASGNGSRDAARRVLERMEETQRPSVAALLHAAIGERGRAIELLEQAYRTASDANLPYWLLHPLLEDASRDKRFQEITRGVGITRRS